MTEKKYRDLSIELWEKTLIVAWNDLSAEDKQYNQAVTYLSKAYSATFNDEIGKHLQQALIAAGDTKAADNLSFAKTSDTQQNVRQQLSDQAVLMLLYYQFGANVSAN